MIEVRAKPAGLQVPAVTGSVRMELPLQTSSRPQRSFTLFITAEFIHLKISILV